MARTSKLADELKGRYKVVNVEKLDKRANDETGKYKNRGIFSRLIKKCKSFEEYFKLVGDTQVQDEGFKSPVSGRTEIEYAYKQGWIVKA